MNMDRDAMIQIASQRKEAWDMVVIGGGATGASIALDATTRGLSVLLLERNDFGKGTSSRSTKLAHGGVRYLAQGNIALVRDALRERGRLARNASREVHERSFLVPCQRWWQYAWYRLGFWLYDWLAGKSQYRRSMGIRGNECIQRIATLRKDRARRGILYSDGQFDDARLLIDILRTACSHGATAINYADVDHLEKDADGQVVGLRFTDLEQDRSISVAARCVINAAGPFCDEVRRLDSPATEPMISASQGVHIVLPRTFLPSDTAIIVPKTSDGRVLFLIPWHDRVVVGTTDTPIPKATAEPIPMEDEIDFLLKTCAEYLVHPPARFDVKSVFTGIRPLVKPRRSSTGSKTSSLSRDHTIDVSESGLITITGGKWTTVRKMAQDCVDRCIGNFAWKPSACKTFDLPLTDGERVSNNGFTDHDFSSAHHFVHDGILDASVTHFVRFEMARTVEDVLARRTRWLFLDVAISESLAPHVAAIMARELRRSPRWIEQQLASFAETAACFRIPGMRGPSCAMGE